MQQSNYLEEIRFWEHPPWSGQRRRTRKCSRRIRRVLFHSISRLIAGWRRGKIWFLVKFRELHLPSSRWTQSQTVRAERRIIPNSITIYWRGQNYKYDLRCDAWAPHWRLECRRGPRSIRYIDGFHTVHHIGWKTSRRVYLTKNQTTSRPDDVWPDMWKHMSDAAISKAKQVGYRKTEARQCPTVERYLLHQSDGCRVQANHWKRAEKLEVPMPASMPCRTRREKYGENCSSSGTRKTKYACIVEADESARKRMERTQHKDHADHTAVNGISSSNHYDLVHNFIFLPKQWKYQMRMQQRPKGGEIQENTGMAADESQKQTKGDLWSKERRQDRAFCVISGHLSSQEFRVCNPNFETYQGRVVLRGDIVKDYSGSYAVFTEQGSSASQMTAAKVMDVIARLPGCAGQAAGTHKSKWKMHRRY